MGYAKLLSPSSEEPLLPLGAPIARPQVRPPPANPPDWRRAALACATVLFLLVLGVAGASGRGVAEAVGEVQRALLLGEGEGETMTVNDRRRSRQLPLLASSDHSASALPSDSSSTTNLETPSILDLATDEADNTLVALASALLPLSEAEHTVGVLWRPATLTNDVRTSCEARLGAVLRRLRAQDGAERVLLVVDADAHPQLAALVLPAGLPIVTPSSLVTAPPSPLPPALAALASSPAAAAVLPPLLLQRAGTLLLGGGACAAPSADGAWEMEEEVLRAREEGRIGRIGRWDEEGWVVWEEWD
ncbi:hypothetical protein JCM10450v2_004103 [Rhodotorula kratochvilovae]